MSLTLPQIKHLKAVVFAAYLLGRAHANYQYDVDQAVAIIESFQKIPEQAIPTSVLRNARGLAILTVTKAGFIVSGRGGKGIALPRTGKGWSGPSAIGTGGMGFGFQGGAQVSEIVIILNTPAAVEAFTKDGDVTLGGNLSVTAGPIGRDAEARVGVQSVMYSYSRSSGVFGGLSVEGTVVATRKEDNAAYYGKPVEAKDILTGKVPAPKGASKLRQILSKWLAIEGAGASFSVWATRPLLIDGQRLARAGLTPRPGPVLISAIEPVGSCPMNRGFALSPLALYQIRGAPD